jgi:hypothetical protein
MDERLDDILLVSAHDRAADPHVVRLGPAPAAPCGGDEGARASVARI